MLKYELRFRKLKVFISGGLWEALFYTLTGPSFSDFVLN